MSNMTIVCCCIVLYCIVLHRIVLYCIVLYCIVSYRIVVYRIVSSIVFCVEHMVYAVCSLQHVACSDF